MGPQASMVWKKMEILKKKRMIVNDCVLTSLGAFDFHRSSIGIVQQFHLDLLSLIYLKDKDLGPEGPWAFC